MLGTGYNGALGLTYYQAGLLDSGEGRAQVGGARVMLGTGYNGALGLTYYQAGLLDSGEGRAQIYGADWNGNFGSLGIKAEYAQTTASDALLDSEDVENNNNTAIKAMLDYKIGKLGIGAGWIDVGHYFAAPGDWLKTGVAVNLSNVTGWLADVSLPLGSNMTVTACGQFLEPKSDDFDVQARASTDTDMDEIDVASSGFDSLDNIVQWKAGLKFALSAATSVDVSYEEVTWNVQNPDVDEVLVDSTEKYATACVNHSFNANAGVKLFYQLVSQQSGTMDVLDVDEGDNFGSIAGVQFHAKF